MLRWALGLTLSLGLGWYVTEAFLTQLRKKFRVKKLAQDGLNVEEIKGTLPFTKRVDNEKGSAPLP